MKAINGTIDLKPRNTGTTIYVLFISLLIGLMILLAKSIGFLSLGILSAGCLAMAVGSYRISTVQR